MKKYLYEGNKIQIVEKKSKFIAESFSVKSTKECEEILSFIRKKYWDATHNCYAFRIDENTKKCSDDGEPSKTAGYPILDIIDKQNINQCLVVVTRYFGGILLGTGGLVHAYSTAAKNVIDISKVIEVKDGYNIVIRCSYENYGKILHFLGENNIFINDTIFLDDVRIDIYINNNFIDDLEKKLQEIYHTKDVFYKIKEVRFAILDGEIHVQN